MAAAAFAAHVEVRRDEVSEEQLSDAQELLRMTEVAVAAGSVTAAEAERCQAGTLANLFLKERTRIEIHGLAARPALNGVCGIVIGELNTTSGRIPVRIMEQDQPLSLRPCNTRPAPKLVPACIENLAHFGTGSLVELGGLSGAAALNRCIGEVLPGGEVTDERVGVRVRAAGDDDDKCVRVRRSNLFATTAESCLVDGEAALARGRPRDALARAERAVELAPNCRTANVLRVRAVLAAGQREPRMCEAKASADAVLGLVGRCGLEAVPPDVCISTSSATAGSLSASADDSGWPRERASTYTVALCARLLASHIHARHRGEGALRIALLGCRWTVEARIDWSLLLSLLGSWVFSANASDEGGDDARPQVHISLVGPELEAQTPQAQADKAEASQVMQQAIVRSHGALAVDVHPTAYHTMPAAEDTTSHHLAVVMCGGIDSEFGSWAPSLAALLRAGVPTAFAGYGGADGQPTPAAVRRPHWPKTWHAGSVPLLERMRAQLVCGPHVNPFRFVRFDHAADAFLLAVCGATSPPTDHELAREHVQERAARLDQLAKLHEQHGQTAVSLSGPVTAQTATRLRRLREDLLAGLVIPPHVSHGDMEKWAQGQGAKKW